MLIVHLAIKRRLYWTSCAMRSWTDFSWLLRTFSLAATQNSMQKLNSMILHSQYSDYSRHDKYLPSRVIKIRYTSHLLLWLRCIPLATKLLLPEIIFPNILALVRLINKSLQSPQINKFSSPRETWNNLQFSI